MGEVVSLIGASGAGKSWWWKSLGYYRPHQVLSLDRLRLQLTDDVADQSINPVVVELRRVMLEHRARQGLPTLVDATNCTREHRNPTLGIVRRYHRPLVAVVFHTPLGVCLQRQNDPERTAHKPGQPEGRSTPADVVTRMWHGVAGVWDKMSLEADCVVHVSPDGKRSIRVGDAPRNDDVRIPWLEEMPAIPDLRSLPWASPYVTAKRRAPR